MWILWEREGFEEYDFWRYLGPDSSPQLGYNWLVLREDVFTFNKSTYSLEAQAFADLNSVFLSKTLPLSVIGRGRGTLVAKAWKLSNLHKLASDSEAHYDQRRMQVVGITADQGTEKGFADVSLLKPANGSERNQYDDRHARMYPVALYMPEHLHALFNAVRHAVEKLPTHKFFINRQLVGEVLDE